MSHRGRGRSSSSNPHRGYSGGGGRGAAQASSAPLLFSNRKFRRSGNGQGPQQQQARVKQSSQGVMPQRGLIPFLTRYEVGKVSDNEEAKQRQLNAILNKLTPQNFARLFQQVMEVNIDSLATLMGLISQIFNRALLEPTFCAIYANFCFHLAGALPDFTDENDDLITFRRLLLNKCQEEFEREEREQAEAEKVEEEGDIKQSEQEREEKRLRSRRRMLGNTRLIGELFKKKMMTERIIHECIKKLLGQYRSPDEEDIEALCILMATTGEMIDHSKARVHMDEYFDMMHKLSTNDKISSRVRFVLTESIDLRKNKWQQKRKVEGPKKIENKEEAKQRQLNAILNKLTPQNFERLFKQVMEVNIDSLVTLTGLVSQIFDRALLEPTFCAMYVNFCFHLSDTLPYLIDEDHKFITFRQLLVNKCQEEFERGGREQAQAEKVEEEGEIKQSEQEREEKMLRSRRRKLGNIWLIGELFKKKMLTEGIIHRCIKNFLGQYPSPDEEIKALCILMATIGEMIDHSKAKVHMDAYFDRMHKLSTNDKISSRVRFMLRDSIDLRKNKWQQRRKVEGPKKIEDVHRDAQQERLAVVRGGRGNHSFMSCGGSKGGRPSFGCKMLEDMAQKSQLRVACNCCGAEVSGGEGDSPWIRREPAPSYRSYNDTNEGVEKQVDKNNGEMGNFTRDCPVLDISSSSSSGEDEIEELLVGKKNTALLASTSSVKERDEDEECVIMDSNLFQTPNVDFEHKLSLSDDNLSRIQDEEVAIISERGHVACRDYPHSRHHCAKFPLNKATHESCCPQCYCYVCDRVAPCKYWKGSSGHCHASDKDPKWKAMRMFHRGLAVPVLKS